jgi:hypothetical protein
VKIITFQEMLVKCLCEQWLELITCDGGLQSGKDFAKIGHKRCGLSLGIILPEGNKVIVLSSKELSNIFCGTGKSIVG